MTVSATALSETYNGNGSTVDFAVPFPFPASTDLVVTSIDVGGARTPLTLGTHYSVAGAGTTAGGTVTMETAPISGYQLEIKRSMALTQPSAQRTQGAFDPVALERALDRQALLTQQVNADIADAMTAGAASQSYVQSYVTAALAAGGSVVPTAWTKTGDGATTTFTLAAMTAADPKLFLVTVNGSEKQPTVDYTVSLLGTSITFLTAPAAAAVIYIRQLSYATTYAAADNSTVLAAGGTVVRSLATRFGERINVKDFGAVGDGVTDDTVALQAAFAAIPVGGCELYAPKGVYVFTSSGAGSFGINCSRAKTWVHGAGKGNTIFKYIGDGTAFNWGTGTPTANMHLCLSDFTIQGTVAAVRGLNLNQFQGFRLRNVEVISCTKANAAAMRFQGCNSGVIDDCDVRVNAIGWEFVAGSSEYPNHMTFLGGQCTGNARAVLGTAGAQTNKFFGVNFASTSTAPAILVSSGIGWLFKGNYFENNAGGANSATIELGDGSTQGQSCVIENNYWTETNVVFGVRIVNGSGTVVQNNHNGSSGTMTFFVRAEVGASSTLIIGNTNPGGGIPMLSDASAGSDSMGIGLGTKFYKAVRGYIFNDALTGVPRNGATASVPLKFRGPSAVAAGDEFQFLFSDGPGTTILALTANIRGTVTIADPATSANVTFAANTQPSAAYKIALGAGPLPGPAPAAASLRATWATKAVGGFVINLEAAPGAGASVVVDWHLFV